MSRRIEGEELNQLSHIIDAARQEASKSTCSKDHRGAIVFKAGDILGRASNDPIKPFKCQPDKCFDVCGLYAMHAERLVLINALENQSDLNGASILHVQVDEENKIQVSGKLRCEDCTGYMVRFLRKGISLKEFILLQEDGWTAYEISEADEVTRGNLGLLKGSS